MVPSAIQPYLFAIDSSIRKYSVVLCYDSKCMHINQNTYDPSFLGRNPAA